MELLQELRPAVNTIPLLGNPDNPNFQAGVADIRAAADVLKEGLEVLAARTDRDLGLSLPWLNVGSALSS